MKLIKKGLSGPGEPGFVKLEAEEAEDLWHVFQLVREGDRVTAPTMRKVTIESGGEKVGSDRVRVTLQLAVEAVEFEPEDEQIRVRGRNLTENDAVKLGAYHTLEIEPGRAFSIEKDEWDAIDLDR